MLLLNVRSRRTLTNDMMRCRAAMMAAVACLALANAGTAEAGPRKSKAAKASRANGGGKPGRVSEQQALADAKVAVLAFEGEDPEPLRRHVIKLLVERGLKVNSTLKAQDNVTQYRDLGAALDLAVYVHGKIKDTGGDRAVATVTIRSAVTGRPVASATFNGFRRGLPFDVEEKLWARVGPAFKRACVAAATGVRRYKAMHIEAGTPL